MSLVEKHRPQRILEIGSGAQGMAYYLPTTPIVGVDLKFNSPIEKNLRPIIASVNDLPFRDGSFEMVVSSDMLEHLEEKERGKAVSELLRVASKQVIIGFPSGETAERIDRQIFKVLNRLKIDPPPWLLEHFLNPYPTSERVTGALPKGFIVRKIIRNGNCLIHKLVIVGEMNPRIYRLLVRLDKISLIQAFSPLMNVGRTYREIMLIERLGTS